MNFKNVQQRFAPAKLFIRKYYLPIIIVGIVALIGILVLTSSHAATPTSSVSASTGTISGCASKLSDTTSSSGSVVKFGSCNAVDVTSFGAVGDGVTDDTAAIQKAFNSIKAGQTLVFPAGKTFRHTAVLTIGVAGSHISGPGTLLATNEQYSSVWVNADNVTIDGGLTFKMGTTTKRWDAYEQMKLRLQGHSGIVLKNITIDGSAAAGVYIGGSTNYLLDGVTVKNTRADGIHNTEGANHGTINNAVVTGVGDDGIAVVSYATAAPCNNITINSPTVSSNVWGRGISVVGGSYITYNNINITSSNAASIYISVESEFLTTSLDHVVVSGGTITNANTNSTVDHGAILLYNSRSGYTEDNVLIENLTISNTRSTASRQVGIIQNGGTITHATLKNLTIKGGPSSLFYTNAPASSYDTIGWTYNGNPVADHIGF